jgi:hypothetical protein
MILKMILKLSVDFLVYTDFLGVQYGFNYLRVLQQCDGLRGRAASPRRWV